MIGHPSFDVRHLLCGILGLCQGAAATAADQPVSAVLHFTNNGYMSGELRASDDPKVLRWQSASFTKPFDFPLTAVNAVHYAVPETWAKPKGEYCFELVGDDIIYGKLLTLTDQDVEVELARAGRVHIRRRHVRWFYRWQGADLIYLGPNGLDGWKDGAPTPQWRNDGGRPATDQPGATLFGDLDIPVKCVIQFELSWKQKPDFVFALGVDDQDANVRRTFCFEVRNSDLVAVGKSDRDADVASLQQLGTGPGHVRVQAWLDQEHQRLLVLSGDGELLANLAVNSENPEVHSGVRLMNTKGDVRLERLRISQWDGQPPREAQAAELRHNRTDNSDADGQPAVPDTESSLDSVAGTSNRTLQVVCRDGSLLSGELIRVEDTHLSLACPSVREPLRLPLTGLRSLIALAPEIDSAASPRDGRLARLEMEGVRLTGRLVNGQREPDASCLVWFPNLALNHSPLHPGAAGRIVYRDLLPRRTTPATFQRRPRGRPFGFGDVFKRALTAKLAAKPSTIRQGMLHLRSGDTISCEVGKIDERGITIKTPLFEATHVPHEETKAVDLGATRGPPGLDKIKRERLLTRPRIHTNAPPTHLICAKNGDFLRGRVLKMDDRRLTVEVRLETRELPRGHVTHIIWLHADELSDQMLAATPADSSKTTRVQTVRAGGNRLTFLAEELNGMTLSGRSGLLGACRVDLQQVDQILFGKFIAQAAPQLVYHCWKLHHATEPRFVQIRKGDDATGRPTGTESPLVGQPAPEFELDLLDGQRFRLADHKGRVVVVDFWATWCGPCRQTMPLVDGVVREFAEQSIEVVAINLQEQPKQIASMLERHNLQMPVALDNDGVVAAKYSVKAIPQTVVIDRDGIVARSFVGGGPKMADSLRDALTELSAQTPSRAASP